MIYHLMRRFRLWVGRATGLGDTTANAVVAGVIVGVTAIAVTWALMTLVSPWCGLVLAAFAVLYGAEVIASERPHG